MNAALAALDQTVFGNPLWAYVAALVGSLLLLGLWGFVRRRGVPRLRRLASGTATLWDDALVATLERSGRLLPLVLALLAPALALQLPPALWRGLSVTFTFALCLQLGLWAQGTVAETARLYVAREAEEGSAREGTVLTGLAFVARLAIWVTVLLAALANLGVEVTTLVTGLGIGGVAAALAVQRVFGNVISALSLYLDRPFDIGDDIVVNGEFGTVRAITWRSTRVAALGGQETTYPNSELAEARIDNYRRMIERRVATRLTLVYGTALGEVKRVSGLLREACEAVEGVRFDRAHLAALGDSGYVYEWVFFVASPEYRIYMDRQEAVLLGVLARLEESGLALAYPTRSLHLSGVVRGEEAA